MKKLALVLAILLLPCAAQAQSPLSKLQQDIATAKATLANLNQQIATTGKAGAAPSKPGACDITLFTNLTIASAVTSIQNCVGSIVAGGAAPFVTDIEAALQSATDANDGTAKACLAPALAIAKAAQGTAEIPAVMSADGSTVVTPEVQAVYPGPILIFQKYREFVTAGGPSNCKTSVQSTINGTMASAL
jgi:hypothetical protein